MVTKIISGAQTGADRAGLDAALCLGLLVGGWIPRGRKTDEGELSTDLMLRYCLQEHVSAAYPPRTEQNVRESDATVLFGRMSSPGSALTIRLCKLHNKRYYENPTADALRYILAHTWNDVAVLNVAGNRERTNPGIYLTTFDTLMQALSPLMVNA